MNGNANQIAKNEQIHMHAVSRNNGQPKRANGIEDLFLDAIAFWWCEFNSSLIKILFNVSHFISHSIALTPLVSLTSCCQFFFSLFTANGNCLVCMAYIFFFSSYWTHIKIIYTFKEVYETKWTHTQKKIDDNQSNRIFK